MMTALEILGFTADFRSEPDYARPRVRVVKTFFGDPTIDDIPPGCWAERRGGAGDFQVWAIMTAADHN